MQYHVKPSNTWQYHAIPCNTMQYHSIPIYQCSIICNWPQSLNLFSFENFCHNILLNTMQYHAIPWNTMQYHAIPCNTMQNHAIPCNNMQYNALPCNTMQYHASLITADGAYHCPVGSIMAIFSSVRSSNSHPDLLVIHPPHFFRSHRSSTLDFHFLSHYSYKKAIMLYKGNHWTQLLAICIPYKYNRTSLQESAK